MQPKKITAKTIRRTIRLNNFGRGVGGCLLFLLSIPFWWLTGVACWIVVFFVINPSYLFYKPGIYTIYASPYVGPPVYFLWIAFVLVIAFLGFVRESDLFEMFQEMTPLPYSTSAAYGSSYYYGARLFVDVVMIAPILCRCSLSFFRHLQSIPNEVIEEAGNLFHRLEKANDWITIPYTVLRTKNGPRGFLSEATKAPKPRESSLTLQSKFFAESNNSLEEEAADLLYDHHLILKMDKYGKLEIRIPSKEPLLF